MADVEMGADEASKRGRGFQGGPSSAGTELLPARNGASSASGTAARVDPSQAARSVEGWIIICTGIHEEATEEDVQELFADFGEVKNLHLNLDRRTGFVKGYALIEYDLKPQADAAIAETNGKTFLEQTIYTDYAFTKPPPGARANNGRANNGGRRRSASPGQ